MTGDDKGVYSLVDRIGKSPMHGDSTVKTIGVQPPRGAFVARQVLFRAAKNVSDHLFQFVSGVGHRAASVIEQELIDLSRGRDRELVIGRVPVSDHPFPNLNM